MKQWLFSIGIIFGLAFVHSPVASAGADDFTITNYDVDMRLTRDSANRSVLTATETITARFPEIDQNRGLEKIFVKKYDGHSLSLVVQSVTDGVGKPLKYHWSEDALRIGDANTYVHGLQTYKITYRQRDVTKFYADTDRDEFYWDMIGVEWRVPIEKATVRLDIDSSLVAQRQGEPHCYNGLIGSTDACTIISSGGHYETTVENIGNGRGVTMALGFAPKTFAPYEMGLGERLLSIWGMIQVVTAGIVGAIIAFVAARIHRFTLRSNELKPIPVEFIPPRDISVTTASSLLVYNKGNVMAAQLIDFAVRHYIKLYQTKKQGFLSFAEYEIEIIKSIEELKEEERELLSDMFGHEPKVGERLNMKTLRNSTAFSTRTLNNDSKLEALIREKYGLKEKSSEMKSWLRGVALFLTVVGVFTLSIAFLVVALVLYLMSSSAFRLTDKGLSTKRYLLGLKEYIHYTEAEQLRLLQSPEGAEKVGSIDVNNSREMVKLYERNLPYAVLFGDEKQWSARLGQYYEQAGMSPDWYSGQSAFNATTFSSDMSSLGTTASSASSSSSSSGGSSGGGSSGGGGGGGGGGGW